MFGGGGCQGKIRKDLSCLDRATYKIVKFGFRAILFAQASPLSFGKIIAVTLL
jgi:hypothetical protein